MGVHIQQPVVDAWNKMHARYRIQIEWGIGGLKQKWRRLMKRLNNKYPLFVLFLEVVAKLTNFFHRQCMNFDQVLPKQQEENEDEFD